MSLGCLGTTRITVQRDISPTDDLEFDTGTVSTSRLVTVATNVKADIGTPGRTPRELVASGTEQLALRCRMQCNPCDISHNDFVTDNKTGKQYDVMWVLPRDELGITYYQVELFFHEGTETGIPS